MRPSSSAPSTPTGGSPAPPLKAAAKKWAGPAKAAPAPQSPPGTPPAVPKTPSSGTLKRQWPPPADDAAQIPSSPARPSASPPVAHKVSGASPVTPHKGVAAKTAPASPSASPRTHTPTGLSPAASPKVGWKGGPKKSASTAAIPARMMRGSGSLRASREEPVSEEQPSGEAPALPEQPAAVDVHGDDGPPPVPPMDLAELPEPPAPGAAADAAAAPGLLDTHEPADSMLEQVFEELTRGSSPAPRRPTPPPKLVAQQPPPQPQTTADEDGFLDAVLNDIHGTSAVRPSEPAAHAPPSEADDFLDAVLNQIGANDAVPSDPSPARAAAEPQGGGLLDRVLEQIGSSSSAVPVRKQSSSALDMDGWMENIAAKRTSKVCFFFFALCWSII